MTRQELEQAALASLELERRYNDNKLAAYVPCCVKHGGRKPDNWDESKGPWFPVRCPSVPKACPDSKHAAFHVSPKRTRIVFGGNRASKTKTCTTEFLFRMTLKRHPYTGEPFRVGQRYGRMFAQDYSLHEKKTLPDLYDQIPRQVLKYAKTTKTKQDAWDQSYDSRNHILYLINGRIDFLSYDQDTSKGESVDLDVVYADEEMPEAWYGATISRLITRNGLFIMGVTPLYGLTWGEKFTESTDPNVEVFNWEIWDNPYNSEKAVNDFIAQIPEHERGARISGKFMSFEGRFYKELDRNAHLVDKTVVPPAGSFIIHALDPHPRKGTVMTWAWVKKDDSVVFFDELECRREAPVSEVAAAIRLKEQTHLSPTSLRVMDPAGKAQGDTYEANKFTLFAAEGLRFQEADNSEDGYFVVRDYLKYDKNRPVGPDNLPAVTFSADCVKTWYGMTHMKWDEYKFDRFSRDPKERPKDKDKDFPDCVRYILALRPTCKSMAYQPVPFNKTNSSDYRPRPVRDMLFHKRDL